MNAFIDVCVSLLLLYWGGGGEGGLLSRVKSEIKAAESISFVLSDSAGAPARAGGRARLPGHILPNCRLSEAVTHVVGLAVTFPGGGARP